MISKFLLITYFLSFALDNVVKDGFEYLSQEFGSKFSKVLDLVKQKGFTLMNIWVILKSLKKNWQAKKSFIVRWPVLLSSSHYLSTLALSWNAMLNMIKSELISDAGIC